MAQLSPVPVFRAFNSSGTPLAGGKLYSFDAGTSTPRATFTDQGGGTPNANPVVLDANGEADVWLDGNYKLRLDDASDVVQWTVDNIQEFSTTINETLSPSAGANAFQFTVTGTINEASSGTHTLLGGVSIAPPTINAGAATVTEVATLYVSAAPSAVGATAYALHVDAGATQLDGTLTVGGATVLAAVTSGDIAIEGSDATLTLKDTDGTFSGSVAIPSIEFHDSGAVKAASIGFNSAAKFSEDLVLETFVTGNSVIIATDSGQLRVEDQSTTGDGASPNIQFRDSDSTLLVAMGVPGETDSHGVFQNLTSGSNLELRTTSGEVHIIDSDAKLVLQDTDGTWGTAIPALEFWDNADTVGASIAVDASEDLLIDNNLTNGDIRLEAGSSGEVVVVSFLTTEANIRAANADPVLFLQDTNAVAGATRNRIVFEDSALTQVAVFGYASASDANLEISNNISGGNIELNVTSGLIVSAGLLAETSDPVIAGALWNNAGVINISSG